MPYGKFKTVTQVATQFDLEVKTAIVVSDISKPVIEVPKYKLAEITNKLSDPSCLRNETARCNRIITPILEVVIANYKSLSLWIEEPFNIDEEKGLAGNPDYLLSPMTKQQSMAVPPVCVIEAKQDKFDEGWTQALAEMVAANIAGAHACYAVVTTGGLWEFGMLEGGVFTKDPVTLSATQDLQKVFAYLDAIVNKAMNWIKEQHYE